MELPERELSVACRRPRTAADRVPPIGIRAKSPSLLEKTLPQLLGMSPSQSLFILRLVSAQAGSISAIRNSGINNRSLYPLLRPLEALLHRNIMRKFIVRAGGVSTGLSKS